MLEKQDLEDVLSEIGTIKDNIWTISELSFGQSFIKINLSP